MVRELIKMGAKIDLQRDDGASALIIASQNRHMLVVREVIAKGAKIDLLAVVEYISRYSYYPVHYLIEHYYSTFLLVSRNIDSSNLIDEAWSKYYSQTGINRNLPLHLLCERYNDMNNNALLGIFSQCEINLKNKCGLTPFEVAFNKCGLTPFEVAFNKHNYLTCIWLMLRKQCDVYLYGTEKNTQRCEAIETLTKQIFEDTHILPLALQM